MTKGNKMHDVTTESHTASKFQSTLADGVDRNKAVRLITALAILGVRSDFLEMKAYVRVASTDGNDVLHEVMYAEAVEWSGVPPEVQYAAFAQNSPFETAEFAIQSGMLKGTDKQELGLTNNVEVASPDAYTTAIAQKVRGVSDDRVTFGGDHADVQTCSYYVLKVKPNHDGIIMLRNGAIIWMQPGIADKA